MIMSISILIPTTIFSYSIPDNHNDNLGRYIMPVWYKRLCFTKNIIRPPPHFST